MNNYDLGHLNVLVVDDNEHMLSILREILRSLHVGDIRVAGDGNAALKEMESFPADLVIADWNMAPMDGLTFVRETRTSTESANPYVPIIMLTGNTEKEMVDEARDSGITEFLAKPVSPKSLYDRICMIIERPRQFIKTDTYVGPDRRRHKPTPKTNKGRRASDKQETTDGT